MSAVYSVQQFVGRVSDTGTTVLYEAPAGKVSIVRDIFVAHVGGADGDTYIMSVNTGGSSVSIWRIVSPDANSTMHTECRIVLEPGDDLRIANNQGTWDVVVSGYELSAP